MSRVRIAALLDDAKKRGRPVFSFEFFPPKGPEGAQNLRQTIASLESLKPDFCSVTYGAGGSTRKLTVEVVSALRNETSILPMAHLTCVAATRDELKAVLQELKAAQIENLLALRGDPPKGSTQFPVTEGGFTYAHQLVELARDEFCVGAAVYPEGHVETRDIALNVAHAKQKVLAGAQFLITQVFFDPSHYFDFVAKLRAAGVYVPVLAGVMPVTDVGQAERFTQMCGAMIPATFREQLEYARHDALATRELGIAYATQQCVRLLEGGAPGIHFYTLNRSASTRAILAALRAWLGSAHA